jgi:hypothetical protein
MNFPIALLRTNPPTPLAYRLIILIVTTHLSPPLAAFAVRGKKWNIFLSGSGALTFPARIITCYSCIRYLLTFLSDNLRLHSSLYQHMQHILTTPLYIYSRIVQN